MTAPTTKIPNLVLEQSLAVPFDDLPARMFAGKLPPEWSDKCPTEVVNLTIQRIADTGCVHDLQVAAVRCGKKSGDAHTIELFQMGGDCTVILHAEPAVAQFVATVLCGTRSARWFFWAEDAVIKRALAVTY